MHHSEGQALRSILDMVMEGGWDGIETLRELKKEPTTKDIPVVMLSNAFSKDIINQAKQEGAVDFWEKTKVLPKDVFQRCKKILGIS